ncbi:MAG TPA: aspartyl protease family protein [Bryobacteraceae bacterium]|nr:aspartyl protease family protein [Bryobacteraceae bacterium]
MSDNIEFRLAGGQNPLILVPVYLDDRGPYQFILDTGASHCLLTEELSVALGVRPEAEKQAMGAGGAVKLTFGHVNAISVGSTRQDNAEVAITSEIQRIAAAIRNAVDGVLGFSFLKDYILAIDYRAQVLSLAHPPLPGGGNESRSVPFQLASASKPLILVPARVNGQGPFQFALDTGASRTMLSSEFAAQLAIETSDDSPATGGGGQIRILAGSVCSLAVGNVAVRDHAIGAVEFLSMLSTAVGAKLDGILGHNFLSQFKVAINYPGRILTLNPVGLET